MKETLETAPAERSIETADQEGFANRKLIRPSLNRNDHPHNNHGHNHALNHGSGERRDRGAPGAPGKKAAPRMQTKTPMVIVLRDGEEVHGIIEWYDKSCIKLNRNGAPNLMIYKPAIKYMFKEGE